MNLRARFNKLKSFFTKENLKPLLSIKFWWRQIKIHKRQLLFLFGVFIFVLLAIPIITYAYFAGDLKDKNSFTNHNNTGVTLLDDQGKPFFTFYHAKQVSYVQISQIPASIQNAAIAAEDRDFYTNPGFSFNGIVRAFLTNFFAGRIVQGGSTISQELVKNALLNSNRNILRKFQELVLATELNRRFSKQDILEMYLNSVYFGEGAFGVENAAKTYFGIHAKDMTLAQSALLVGILPAPSAYSPLSNNPQIGKDKQQQVLSEMVAEKMITQQQEDQAISEKLVYQPLEQNQNVLAPHFAIYVKDLLVQKYGEERIINDGFQVTTTLNSKWQTYAEQVVKNQVLYLQRNKATNGAVIVIDPTSGAIKVMVGSHDWNDEKNGKINMSLHPRQPGSSFKPFIYADALEQHLITSATLLKDNPIAYGDYKPLDYDKRFRGDVTVRRALSNSLNIPAVQVLNMLGVPEGLTIAQKFGIDSLGTDASKYGLSLVLGSGEVSLLEMTNGYAVFADQGIYHTPYAVTAIKDKYGNTVTDNPQNIFSQFLSLFNFTNIIAPQTQHQERIVIGEDTAYLISSILSDNNARAEEFGNALTIFRPAAVKTGTTNDFKDALTIGYTPGLVIGVWVGNNDNNPMDNIAGSLGAAPIWRLLMENFLTGTPLQPFIQPASIVKMLPCSSPVQTPGPNNTMTASLSAIEYFIRGTEPPACPTPTITPTNSPSETPTPSPTNAPSATPAPTDSPTPTEAPTPTPIVIIPTTLITPIPTP